MQKIGTLGVNGLTPLGDGNLAQLPSTYSSIPSCVNGLTPLGDGNSAHTLFPFRSILVLMALPH